MAWMWVQTSLARHRPTTPTSIHNKAWRSLVTRTVNSFRAVHSSPRRSLPSIRSLGTFRQPAGKGMPHLTIGESEEWQEGTRRRLRF